MAEGHGFSRAVRSRDESTLGLQALRIPPSVAKAKVGLRCICWHG